MDIRIIALSSAFLIARHHTLDVESIKFIFIDFPIVKIILLAGCVYFNFNCLRRDRFSDLLKYSLFLCVTPYVYIQFFHAMLMSSVVVIKKLWRSESSFNEHNSTIKFVVILILYGFLITLLGQAREINLLAYPFFIITFFSSFSAFFVAIKIEQEDCFEIIRFLRNLAISVFIAISYSHWILGIEGWDNLTGGTINAHHAAFLLSVLALYNIVYLRINQQHFNMLLSLIIIGMIFYYMYITDSKAHIISIFSGLFSVILIRLWYAGSVTNRIGKIAFFYLLGPVLIASVWFGSGFIPISKIRHDDVRAIISQHIFSYDSARTFILLDWWSQLREEPLISIMGRGPGTFLSKAGISRAFDILSKYEQDLTLGTKQEVQSKLPSFIPPFSSSDFRKFAYPKIFFKKGDDITWTSSLVAFLWEYGLIGFCILSLLFWQQFKQGVVLSFIDNKRLAFIGFLSAALTVAFFLNAGYRGFLEVPYNMFILYALWGMSSQLSTRMGNPEE
ncbi:MAG: hypothetical protein SV375_01825 [Thermodesulfobacteriota bacterium]|nr:hypothetical protein [Thermodesulfobacteriota bacterium]